MRRAVSIFANDGLLLLTAAIWGLAFVAQRAGMDHVGPFTYNAVRFALGALSLVPLVLIRRARFAARAAKRAARSPAAVARPVSALLAGLLAGGVLFFGASLQQAGIVTTTAGKAGFITGLYVVLVPLSGLMWGQRAGWSAWAGALMSVVGLFLLSVTASFTIGRGDLLVLVSSLFWTAHVQLVGWLSPRTDPVRLSCVQFAVCSLLCAVGAVVTERVLLSDILAAAGPILYGGVLSVGVAYTLQVVAQRSAPPAHAAILLSLETVFAAIGGGLLLDERLGLRGSVGCAVMFAGMIVSQVPLIVASLARPAAARINSAMDRHEETTARVMEILRKIPGVVGVAALSDQQRMEAVGMEARYEGSSVLPIRNLGVRMLADRRSCVAILKDGSFRPPRMPTVYLVEEGEPERSQNLLVIEGKRYAIVGQEVTSDGQAWAEPTIPLESSFVIFPERRSGPDVPCAFILPPIRFPELDARAEVLGIDSVVSISPSLAADAFLRESFGFPPTNELATLLIGWNPAARARHSPAALDEKLR